MVRVERAWWCALALLLLCGLPVSAPAAGLQISPISLSVAADSRVTEIWLRNNSQDVVHAQVRVYRWSQSQGQDVLTADNALIASPPMVAIPAGGQQLVRLVRVGALAEPAAVERSYRLLVDELPVQQQQKSETSLRFVFRYSVPVFIAGTAKQKAKLDWRVEESDGHAWLIVSNTGTRHVQLADVSFAAPHGKAVAVLPGLAGYVLAGQQRRFKLPLPPSAFAQGGVFSGRADGAEINTRIESIRH